MRILTDLAIVFGAFCVCMGVFLAFGWVLTKTSWFRNRPQPTTLQKPLRWWMLVAAGLLSGALGYAASAYHGFPTDGAYGFQAFAGPMVGIPVFGILGGLIFRRLGAEFAGQFYGAIFGAIGFGTRLLAVIMGLGLWRDSCP